MKLGARRAVRLRPRPVLLGKRKILALGGKINGRKKGIPKRGILYDTLQIAIKESKKH